jgi:hypothetical protein
VENGKDDVEVEAGDDRLTFVEPRGDPAIDRQDSFLAGPRHHVHFTAAARGPRRLETGLLDDLRGRDGRRLPIGERPASIFFDAKRYRFVPRSIEIGKHRGRRGERHLVLTGPAAVKHTYSKSFHTRRIQVKREKRKGRTEQGNGTRR